MTLKNHSLQFKNAPPACSATAVLGYFYYMLFSFAHDYAEAYFELGTRTRRKPTQ
jgi:hypothetical protein